MSNNAYVTEEDFGNFSDNLKIQINEKCHCQTK